MPMNPSAGGGSHQEALNVDTHPHTSDDDAPPNVADESINHPDREGFGPAIGPTEAALAFALREAAAAGRFDVVAQLARELEVRRLAREPNVVALPAAKEAP